MNILSAFGHVVRTRREALGLTQADLAQRAGMHRTYVGGVERGERNLTLKNMSSLSNALNTKISDLLIDVEAFGTD